MQRVHPDRVAGRLDLRVVPRGLQDPELRLKLDDVPAERVERVADAVGLIALLRDGEVLDARK